MYSHTTAIGGARRFENNFIFVILPNNMYYGITQYHMLKTSNLGGATDDPALSCRISASRCEEELRSEDITFCCADFGGSSSDLNKRASEPPTLTVDAKKWQKDERARRIGLSGLIRELFHLICASRALLLLSFLGRRRRRRAFGVLLIRTRIVGSVRVIRVLL